MHARLVSSPKKNLWQKVSLGSVERGCARAFPGFRIKFVLGCIVTNTGPPPPG